MEKLKKIISILVIVILIPLILINVVIIIDSIINRNRAPGFFGWKPIIVISDTMENVMYPGDLAIVKEEKIQNINKNDIIAFKYNDIILIHRVVDIVNEDGTVKFITKGDNKTAQEEQYILEDKIEGIYKSKLAILGNVALFLQTPVGIILGVIIVLFLILLVVIKRNSRNNEKDKKNENDKFIENDKKEDNDNKEAKILESDKNEKSQKM